MACGIGNGRRAALRFIKAPAPHGTPLPRQCSAAVGNGNKWVLEYALCHRTAEIQGGTFVTRRLAIALLPGDSTCRLLPRAKAYSSTSLPGRGSNIRIRYVATAYTMSALRVAKSTTNPEYFKFGRILANGDASGPVIVYIHATNGVLGLTTKNLNTNLNVNSSSIMSAAKLMRPLKILNIAFLDRVFYR